MKTYLVNNHIIPLGIQGENEARRFAFCFPDYAEYAVVVSYLRPGAQMAYAPAVVHEGEMVYWTATEIDTETPGEGCAVFNFFLQDELRKSLTYEVRVAPDPTSAIGPQPDDFESWYRALQELQLRTQEAADSINAELSDILNTDGVATPGYVWTATDEGAEWRKPSGGAGGGASSWSELYGKPFERIGSGLKVVNSELCVDTADAVEQDNTKPITAAAVYTTVGNISTLLSLI